MNDSPHISAHAVILVGVIFYQSEFIYVYGIMPTLEERGRS